MNDNRGECMVIYFIYMMWSIPFMAFTYLIENTARINVPPEMEPRIGLLITILPLIPTYISYWKLKPKKGVVVEEG